MQSLSCRFNFWKVFASTLLAATLCACTPYEISKDIGASLGSSVRATLTGAPTGTNTTTTLSVTVGGTGVVNYKYKVGSSTTTSCSSSTGYSSATPIATLITDSISAVADGTIVLCVLGIDSSGMAQPLSAATTASWGKDVDNFEVSFAKVQDAGDEGSSKTITVSISSSKPYDVILTYGISGDASSSTNYSITGSGTVTIPANATSASIALSLPNNLDVESSKLLQLNALKTDASKGLIGTNSTLRYIIRDNDGDPGTPSINQISLGQNHSCFLENFGGLYAKCGGDNQYGQLGNGALVNKTLAVASDSSNQYSAISAGSNHVCGIISSSSNVACWGKNDLYQLADTSDSSAHSSAYTSVDIGTTYSSIDSGGDHNCGITSLNKLRCWGSNSYGQLAKALSTTKDTPAFVDSGNDYSKVSAGTSHNCAIRSSDSSLYCWGRNNVGQLGDNSTTDRLSVTLVDSGTAYSSVSAGADHTCAITTGGVLKCWGDNTYGQLGDASNTQRTTPVIVNSGTLYSAVSAGNQFTCAITNASVLKCWGRNDLGQLGDSTKVDKNSVTIIDSGTTYSKIEAGDHHACGYTAGTIKYLKCWGGNRHGEVLDNSNGFMKTPTVQDSGVTYSNVSVGASHLCAVTSGSALNCYGLNSSKQLGDNNGASRLGPVQIATSYAQVSSGSTHSCGITGTGALYCWGTNTYGQVGDGSTTTRSTPVLVDSGVNYSVVSAGLTHTCGVTSAGELKCWGRNNVGQVGDGSASTQTSPVSLGSNFSTVSAGENFSCAITSGTHASPNVLKCWGVNTYSQLGDGTTTTATTPITVDGTNTYSKISVGKTHACAITSASNASPNILRCWGGDGSFNIETAVTNATTPTSVDSGNTYTEVTTGAYHSCAVATGGALKCWGLNSSYQIGNNSSTAVVTPTVVNSGINYSKVSASGNLSCGVTTANVLKCWGDMLNFTPSGQSPSPWDVSDWNLP